MTDHEKLIDRADAQQVCDFYLYSTRPENGPHEGDTRRVITANHKGCGRCFRLLCIRDGVPEHSWWLADRFRVGAAPQRVYAVWSDRHRAATWSWGNAAIIASDKFAAATYAREVLGDQFKGWVNRGGRRG